ncbi:MAG TPA: transketolase C-terminal domain-containing protein [bacterium]|nr:transketolase C-terminal domain-containing protein [bacterium]
MEIFSKVHGHNLVKWAADKKEVIVLSADLTSSCEADLFRDAYPDRFFSLGIAEQNMLSWAAGMAGEGFVPYIHTFAVFIYRRAYDQVAMSAAYSNIPVKMIGFLPGVTTPGGASHQAIEDISLMRSLPNMTVLETGDATDVETVLDAAHKINGPVYIRMLRGEIPRLFKDPLVFNRSRVLSNGTDITLLTSGICTEEAMRATKLMKEKGVSVCHHHISTLKPFTDPQVENAISQAKFGVITMENHSVIGGLGTCVAEIIASKGLNKKLVKLGIQDRFLHGASRRYLMKEHGIDAVTLIKTVEKIIGKELNISESELGTVRIEAVHSESKAEAL